MGQLNHIQKELLNFFSGNTFFIKFKNEILKKWNTLQSSRLEVSYKESVLKNFAKFTGKHGAHLVSNMFIINKVKVLKTFHKLHLR